MTLSLQRLVGGPMLSCPVWIQSVLFWCISATAEVQRMHKNIYFSYFNKAGSCSPSHFFGNSVCFEANLYSITLVQHELYAVSQADDGKKTDILLYALRQISQFAPVEPGIFFY